MKLRFDNSLTGFSPLGQEVTGSGLSVPTSASPAGAASPEQSRPLEGVSCYDAMIAAGDADHPALRLTLTSTAYANIATCLEARLSALKAQKAVAFAADRG